MHYFDTALYPELCTGLYPCLCPILCTNSAPICTPLYLTGYIYFSHKGFSLHTFKQGVRFFFYLPKIMPVFILPVHASE